MDNYIDLNNFEDIPVVPLRGLVVYPNMTLHFDVGRKKSVAALNTAMDTHQMIFLVSQIDSSIEDPSERDVYEVGVICKVKQMIKIPNSSNLRVIVEGIARASIVTMYTDGDHFNAVVDRAPIYDVEVSAENTAYIRTVKKEYEVYASIFKKISNEVVAKIICCEDIAELTDYICENSFFSFSDKQAMLEEFDPQERIKKLTVLLKKETTSLEIEAEIQDKLQKEIDKGQREYYLREEMKVISDELGEGETPLKEADEYKTKINNLKCSDEIKSKLLKECEKLIKMPSGSHEGTVVRTYLDKCLEIPFGKYSKDRINLERSRKILDADHYGLDKVKTRIIESLAVLKRNPEYNGQIICLYGPPGVGKTSIVKSLAKSMNRKYVRIALGGVNDEAEIRGHRKTYIGSMPGRIMQAIIDAGTMNPIVLLDEIDKVGNDYKGDPSSALLEALDPEQNNSFNDHYIDFPIDLSKVLFITTANDTSTISAPLHDRMEIIELNSYSIEEKFNIAKQHLVKKELKKHNLSAREFKISDDAIYKIIECYTREAGVRSLEKNIATLCRKATVDLENGKKSFKVTDKNLSDYLGVEKYSKDEIPKENQIGVVNGLAWTQVGGTMLPIEISALDGTGKIELTGNLGDVMKESAKTAVSYVRSKTKEYGIESDFYKTKDIHIHAPEAAIPKDGPSAGLAITTALVSELTGVPIKRNVAMTGEISLKGKALPIGGLKEKSMAAYKAGCDTVIIPKDNFKDLSEICDEVKTAVRFIPVSSFDEVMIQALEYMPKKDKKQNIIIKSDDTVSSAVTQ
ncbi:endopeptidase La [Eubacterium coprostanoligenes]|uniref:endopeptidase La n=1 Tax=Eubacterium coprostanoligenes TaxID=290054 RepID=UPI002357C438|nr:endopeptidase La [Eubacterium coprostanoligenes]MCI6254605.1 endopeptidase La [Eubacterium coprostanoligenes]MDY5400669.1 endopeptidase La [Eubacterium coprostanoligenes]